MLKILIKKQFRELFSLYTIRKKKSSSFGRAFLAFFIVLVVLGSVVGFYALAVLLGMYTYGTEYSWVPFSIFIISALLVSVVVNIFISSGMLFGNKDNLLLLSLPIKPQHIVLSRMSVLYFNCFIFTGAIWLPLCVNYCISGYANALSIISQLVMLLILPIITLVISSVIGWIFAFLSRKKVAKTLVSVLLMAVLLVFFIGVRVLSNDLFTQLIQDPAPYANAVMSNFYPLYILSAASFGDLIFLAISILMAMIPFAIIYYAISKSFIKITTSSKKSTSRVKKGHSQNSVHEKSQSSQYKNSNITISLLKKEWNMFITNSTYVVNTAIGVVIIFAGAIVLAFFGKDLFTLNQGFELMYQNIPGFVPLFVAVTIGFVGGMDFIDFPSISLEGRKNIWILKTLPIEPKYIFRGKILLHIIVNLIPSIFAVVLLSFVYQLAFIDAFLVFIFVVTFNIVTAMYGMRLGLKRANLDWYNVTQPIKQNIGILFCILFVIIVLILFIIVSIICGPHISLIGFSVLFILLSLLIKLWLSRKGAKIFMSL
ncbi:MAG: hypothetical protein MJ189_01630 [Coriobacteriales bacterium]|nr:hypothetical protein [Coriobacteriales bacterium]